MKAIVPNLLLILASAFLSSCSADFYIPRQSNLIVLENKKDLKVSLAYNHAQAAYSPAKHIGLKADASFINVERSSAERNLVMGNIGIGYYAHKPILANKRSRAKLKSHPKLCLVGFDIYANFGLGHLETQSSSSSGSIFFFGDITSKSFRTDILNPNVSCQLYFQTRSFTCNIGLRYDMLFYYNARGFGDYSEFDQFVARSLVEETPFSALVYDFHVSSGNSRLGTFAQLSWNGASNAPLDNIYSFSFGLKANINNLIESIKANKQ